MTERVTVNVNLIVVCGFTGCPWSMEIDRTAGADPMAVHDAYLQHLDEHDPDGAQSESADHWVSVAEALAEECPSCKAAPGQPHTDFCKLPGWAKHDAEVARALAEDAIPATFTCPRCCAVSHHPEDIRQGYCGRCHEFTGLYAGDTPSRLAAEQARIDRFMAGSEDR